MSFRLLSFILTLGLAQISWAQVFGPNAVEVRFNYTAEFVTADYSTDPTDLAYQHSSHLYGVLSTPEMVEKHGLPADLIGGIGVPRSDITFTIRQTSGSGGKLFVRYSASGKMLLHKKAAARIMRQQKIVLPMPMDLDTIYDRNCTDEHYDSPGDYWYFWNPFREGCAHLAASPYSTEVEIRFNSSVTPNQSVTARLDLLRGDNQNGKEFSIYVVHGFNETTSRRDEGRLNYNDFHRYLRKNKFKERINVNSTSRELRTFTKPLTLPNGEEIEVVVRSLLVDTGIGSRSVQFAKFFKQAVLEADVIFYAGHSGLGGNLDIPSLESKVGEFVVDPKKRQIFYFDSCSSYSYYLESFRETKTRSKIDIITNGLSSYFEFTAMTTAAFFDALLDVSKEDRTWMSILKDIERPLNGGTYLLNVGGI